MRACKTMISNTSSEYKRRTTMEWVLRSPQIHSTFSNLGYVKADGYHVNESCNSALETILHNILVEDKFVRTYRRSISFGQNIKKDIIPLLIHAKDDTTVELIIKILVNLTIPIECLLNVDLISKTDFGRHTIFEINNLLTSTKAAFTELQTSKALVDFLKKNVDVEQKVKLSEEQRTNVSNCLLLLRNILHIPEENLHNGSAHSIQNQILWNIFSQSVDKVIIKSMTICDASFWGVTMVQLVALLYKDQHVVTLHKLLNNWLEASHSESSEDNESNTSLQDRAGSYDSSKMLTSSDPTSDSSDNGGCSKSVSTANPMSTDWDNKPSDSTSHGENNQTVQQDKTGDDKSATSKSNEQDTKTGDDKSSGFETTNKDQIKFNSETTPSPCIIASDRGDQNKKQTVILSETSDCGYGTQIENQKSISTSSNEEDVPTQKPVHQKPHNIKQRPNNKPRPGATTQERKRKKIIKRGKTNIINVQGLSHKTPTDDDISNVLKEFTVDFLLKGYNSLVQTLYSEILTNPQLEIDTSHFFWLVTYFLKFATQIELDLEHVESVLSFEIVSYLTSEGVNLCEQFELAIKMDGSDLSPNIRRLHLVVTAIREFVQAIEVYKKIPHLNEDNQETLKRLQIKMCETEDLRSMLVLLLRHYNPKYHSKQYLQDLVVTNHVLLIFLDNTMKIPDYNCSTKMIDHIRQFATPEVMAQYGLLLDDYLINGEFVNDCIFTLMHHVGGEAGSLIALFQSKILNTFTAIWKSDFEICDDWSDLIEFVINTFVKKPNMLNNVHLLLEQGSFGDIHDTETVKSDETETTLQRWTEDEISSLSWMYLQSSAETDVIDTITKQLKEDGIDRTRDSVIRELFRQNLISIDFYVQLKGECDRNTWTVQLNKASRDEEIGKFCEHLILDGKLTCLDWVQNVLLEICYAKLHIQKRQQNKPVPIETESKLLDFELFNKDCEDLPVVSPVAYHSLILQQSVPLVPWNCQQASVCKDLKFLQLLHKLGFQMPVDTGRLFIRIPHFWTAEYLFGVAGRIRCIDKSKLKFSVSELADIVTYTTQQNTTSLASDILKDVPMIGAPDNFYQIHEQRLAMMVNFTPRPGPVFSSEAETEQLNWLQVVQKSQECKITLNLQSFSETTDEDIVMKLPTESRETTLVLKSQATAATASAMLPGTSAMLPGTSAMLPGTSAMSIKQETLLYNMHFDAPEHYNSASDTASVASDLTHMYVSDEEEKPEVVVRPAIDLSTTKEQTSRNKTRTTGKRRRGKF